ncbi:MULTISPECIES: lysophospholipase [unclassified Thermosipho (in: thermotogales)]|uniref:alpha/beta hydrolase n=1 Tax=unclassified Thermosipho (in: thermotogales) TaxID=2676525 RepID=UPI0009873787|nr:MULTISPECIES: lysophospholipase [unclassified Thermosipho (in: thermotogales)]MBT1247689.1 lysophospholipase [Thermosipho sp. 1244]OOC46732.1 lysophospholipase [Thermosipho sp. 1223]
MYFVSSYDVNPNVIKKDKGKVLLQSNYPCEYKESSRLPLYLYESKNKIKGVLLFIHGLGTNNLKYLKWFPRNFSEFGYNSALMVLPYHFERTPKGYKSGQLFLSTTDNPTLRSRFEHAVVDVLTSLNYLKKVYGRDIYLMGFSFGGMVSTIAASFSRDIKGLSLCVTGGNFYYITWKSFVTKVLRVQYEQNKECNPQKCADYHGKEFLKYISNLKTPAIEIDSAPIACYEYDPIVFAKFVTAPVIMFRALFDVFIPKKSTVELFNNFGSLKKEIHSLPSGHLSSYIFKKRILKLTMRFFEN